MVRGLLHIGETESETAEAERAAMVVMLPARNAEEFLPSYLENVASFCDSVVALDDGSTDSTYDILASHPLVKVLLSNPRRDDYRAWDDASNRNRLLAAASDLQPAWLFSLDADERLDERDAASLLEFIRTDALPGFAYGFRHVSMRGDTEHFLPKYWWYYRLFSYAPGQRFPNKKLHFMPVPTNIPRSRWLKTSLRIQHLGELDVERRLERFGKYLEADPTRKYENNYGDILANPPADDLRRWLPRPECVPVLFGQPDLAIDGLRDGPALPGFSVIVLALDDEVSIDRTIWSVLNQQSPGGLEALVVTHEGSATERQVRGLYPSVKLVTLTGPAVGGAARNQGLLHASGRFVVFLTPADEMPPGSLASRFHAHARGYAMVAGTIINGMQTPAAWASYFLEHARTLPGQPSAEVPESLSICSYAQLPLNEVGGFPEIETVEVERVANEAIIRRGYVVFREAEVQTIQCGPRTIADLVISQFLHGRRCGSSLLLRHQARGQLLRREQISTLVAEFLPGRLRLIEACALQANDETRSCYCRYRPFVTLGALAAALGLGTEVLKPGKGKAQILWGRPLLTVLLGGQDGFALAQVDAESRTVTLRGVSPQFASSVGAGNLPLIDPRSRENQPEAQQALLAFRRAAAEAFDIEDLECIIDPELTWSSVSEERLETTQASGIGRLEDLFEGVIGVSGQRMRAVRSTLGHWTTLRVLKQVRAASSHG